MKPYAKYFGEIVKNNGQPRLSDSEYRRLMNVIYLNGRLQGMQYLRTKLRLKSSSDPFDMDVYIVSKKLTELTGNLEPAELLKEMLERS